jgi:hypothetical protein
MFGVSMATSCRRNYDKQTFAKRQPLVFLTEILSGARVRKRGTRSCSTAADRSHFSCSFRKRTQPETMHRVTLSQIRRWCDGVAVSPDEILKRRRVKSLID